MPLSLCPVSPLLYLLFLSQGIHSHSHSHTQTQTHTLAVNTVTARLNSITACFPKSLESNEIKSKGRIHIWNLCWCQRWCIEMIWALKSIQRCNATAWEQWYYSHFPFLRFSARHHWKKSSNKQLCAVCSFPRSLLVAHAQSSALESTEI